MIAILLTILKALGLLLLILLGILVFVCLSILFVPVRYKITIHRKTGEEAPATAMIRFSWFLHIINGAFSYPEAAYLKIRIFFLTIFRSDKSGTGKEKKKPKTEPKEAAFTEAKKAEKESEAKPESEKIQISEMQDRENGDSEAESTYTEQESKDKQKKKKKRKKIGLLGLFKKLWDSVKNIQYTIIRICDKIKHIVKNIQYYTEILKSETFRRTWQLCSGQILILLKMLRPKKIKGSIVVGAGDPAGTGQILAAFGIIYPFLDADIVLVPDFEQAILEGDLTARGKITIFRLLKIGITVYFNKDMRRIIQLLKREAA